jgi:PelA/Pel-15E family pectate lyase
MVNQVSILVRFGWAIVFGMVLAPSAIAKSSLPEYLKKPDAWFAGVEAKTIAANILSYQSDSGGWPKNTDTTSAPYAGDRAQLKATFDNSATTDELRFLARIFNATGDESYRRAIDRGIDHILQAQYPTGGWPQYFPPPKSYHRHITFNDDAMVRLMEFLREVYQSNTFKFVSAEKRANARAAFDRGIACILKCQIKVNGKLTAWCAQHDEMDLSPKPGRSYELVSTSGAESVKIVRLLMSIDHPEPEVMAAIEGAVSWFDSVKLTGIRVEVRPDAKSPKGTDKVVVKDSAAPALWARFYEIGTNRPIFSDRDGVAKWSLADLGYERRNGYAWLGSWPRQLLDKDYPVWKKKQRS